jgi:hypothetical protein
MRRVRQAIAADAAASPAANPSAAPPAWSEENRHALAHGIVEHVMHRAGTVAVARLLGEPPQMRTGLVTLGAPGEDGCFAVVYEASGGAAEERGTLPAHDVFRYAVELPPPSFVAAQHGDDGILRDAWWEGVRQRVPDTAVFVRSRTVTALRSEWCSIDDLAERRMLLAREPGVPPPVPKAYQTALECAAHVYECGSAPLTLSSARLRHQRHMRCGEYVINCAPPGADDEVVCCSVDGTWAERAAGGAAAPAAASVEGHRFIKTKECPLAAYAAAAVAVTAPPDAPGNKRVECDGGLHVR